MPIIVFKKKKLTCLPADEGKSTAPQKKALDLWPTTGIWKLEALQVGKGEL